MRKNHILVITQPLVSAAGLIAMVLAISTIAVAAPAAGPYPAGAPAPYLPLLNAPTHRFVRSITAGSAPAVTSRPAIMDVDLIHDGGFEQGSPNPFWQAYSLQFHTPLCKTGPCIGNYARSGSWWAWFGGATGPERAAITQTLRIPTGPVSLRFYVWLEHSTGFVTDTLRVLVDGNQLWGIDGESVGYSAGYTPVTLDMAAYADGGVHAISVVSQTNDPGLGTSFMLDDVALIWQPAYQTMLPAVRKAP